MNETIQSPQTSTADSVATLVINCGSSSIKFALFAGDKMPKRIWSGALERIGLSGSRFHAVDASGLTIFDDIVSISDHAHALVMLLEILDRHPAGVLPTAVGHRVVHGGPDCDCSLAVDRALVARLRGLVPLAPLHLPHNLAGITALAKLRPDLPQVASFDTAFHDWLPRVARLTGLPKRFEQEGIRRYGFHGLSYEYVIEEIRRRYGDDAVNARIVVAHLGNGASMAAIRGGRSIETSMGFSTLAGLPMGTRCGDLDPGIILYLLTERGLSPRDIERLLYKESGLLGVSGISRDMVDLLARENSLEAGKAIDFFCYRARQHLVALTAPLGGLDRLVFTGGIGANAPTIRSGILRKLDYLGVEVDPAQNAKNDLVISANTSRVHVDVFPSDEEMMIARHTIRMTARMPAKINGTLIAT